HPPRSTLFPYTTLFRSDVDDMDALAGAHDDPHVVLDEQDAAAEVVGNAGDELHEFIAFRIRKPGRRLVEQHELRGRRQGARDAEDRKSTRLNSSHRTIS